MTCDDDVFYPSEWLMELDNIKEIETRVYMGDLQWKYWKNKTWNSIALPV